MYLDVLIKIKCGNTNVGLRKVGWRAEGGWLLKKYHDIAKIEKG